MDKKGKIWNKNYILLLQGQLVSTIGDSLYSIALAFFVLKLTGSTALVGMIMGIVTIPRIILGPFAGTIVDRYNRKMLIVWADLIRGISIVAVSFLAYNDMLKVWMLMAVAVIDGVCATFFNPAMETVMPMVVPEDKLVKANSICGMGQSAADIIGQTIGGALYKLLGAPMIFLINGISYIFSAGTETCIKVPYDKTAKQEKSIWQDMKQGLAYINRNKGLFWVIVMSFFINFLFGNIRVLLIPWFTYTEGFGEARYGFLNGACSAGMIVGMLILSIVTIKDEIKYHVYRLSVFAFIGFVSLGAAVNKFWSVVVCFILAFMFQIVFNMLLNATVMVNTPENMRGKVSAVKLTLCMAASPAGNFIGGFIAEAVSPRMGIIYSGAIAFVIAFIILCKKDIRQFMS